MATKMATKMARVVEVQEHPRITAAVVARMYNMEEEEGYCPMHAYASASEW